MDTQPKKILHRINQPKDLDDLSTVQLNSLAAEIRDVIVQQVSQKGGHLASNLGAVELTLALHKVFDAPKDKIIWDVGHQAYPHKLITGRYERFHTLKQHHGISGFPSRKESEYDAFGVGHASTSLAAAMGFAVGRTLQEKDERVIAVIGDGSLTGGMAYDALNNAGASEENVIFVLNDNNMAIAPNVGAVHKYLNRVISNPTYNRLKKDIWDFTGKFQQIGSGIRKLVQKVDESVKHLVLPGGLFEDLGLRYFGPINGHDVEELIQLFNHIKKLHVDYIKGPCLVHVLTEKGRGYPIAEKDSYHWHASSPFDRTSGERKGRSDSPSFAKVFGEALTQSMSKDKRIVGITAAMPDGTGLEIPQQKFPDRIFDVGISEPYAVTFAAGLACQNIIPVVAIYSTFLQRSIDQIIHDVALQNLKVIFVMSHGGLVGEDGPTHHGIMDFSYLRMIPNMAILAPSDENELRYMFQAALKYDKGPIALRYPKGNALAIPNDSQLKPISIGKPNIIQQGKGLLMLSAGYMLHRAKEAARMLKTDGITPTIVDARTIKPLSESAYKDLLSNHSAVMTLEDNVISGGYGSAILEFISTHQLPPMPVHQVGVPDRFIPHGANAILYKELKMDAEGIAHRAKAFLKSQGQYAHGK